MSAENRRLGGVRDALTRERKTPDFIQEQINYFGSEAAKRQSLSFSGLAIYGLAIGVAMFGLGCLALSALSPS